MPRRSKKLEPQIVETSLQKMVVISGKGTPEEVFTALMPAFYGSVFTLNFATSRRGGCQPLR